MASIYISSTYADLKGFREAVYRALRQLRHDVIAMEDYVASDQRPLERCLADVERSDLYLGIFAWRYGYVPKEGNPEGRSITELEYRRAVDAGKPRLLFLLHEEAPWPLMLTDAYRKENEAGRRIEALRQALEQERLVSFFSTEDELAKLAAVAVTKALAQSCTPAPPPPPASLLTLRDALAKGAEIPALDVMSLHEILAYPPSSLEQYRVGRVAEWSQPRYVLDQRFTRLTLLLDQGADAQGPRWQAQRHAFQDLRDVLAAAKEPALVLLGPPGCGKSTLLRRLELDLAVEGLQAGPASEATPLSFFVPLSRYKPVRPGDPLPLPSEWLAQEWVRRYPHLPALPELLRRGRFMLLLDALNEVPHAGEADYRERVALWRDFLADLAHTAPGARAVFCCRSLDYSASLSTPNLSVLHVRIERLADPQVEEFLTLYRPDDGPAIWRALAGTPQLDLFRSPFYLKLLLAQVEPGGKLPQGRAALFTGFVRHALMREVEGDNPLFRSGALLEARDHDRVVRREWRGPYDLPARSPLFGRLDRLAFAMQEQREAGEASQVRIGYDEALALLDGERAEELLRGGVALQVLELQWDEVLYLHQLLQEYFAARALTAASRPELAWTAWRAEEMSPRLEEVLASLPGSDPLEAPATGWEETCLLAAAMVAKPEAFVSALAQANLPLAGRCAAQPDVAVSPALRARLQQALVERSREPAADLRARIVAARALGELGDPRFELCQGRHGEYLLPSMVSIKGGTYPIGSDEGDEVERLPHEVTLASFAIGRFPVTNAEWRLFMDAGGYEDERWWETEAAKAWRREGTTEGPKQQWREYRQWLQANFEQIRERQHVGRITSKRADDWESYAQVSDAGFEALLERWYPPGQQTRPALWDDPAFNHPAQPVVGICWHEARAYCAWLSAQTGVHYRLPTEAEWEAAARGSEGRRYAWGENFDPARCNTFEAHVHATIPIGVFPGGDTPEGLVDMAGNVWEWTGSLYRPYPYRSDDGREDPEPADDRRVVRGGSWYSFQGSARAAYREHHHYPSRRGRDLGFRVVYSSPIARSAGH